MKEPLAVPTGATLKPCPFCGLGHLLADEDEIRCIVCDYSGPGAHNAEYTEAQRLAAWNRRADPERAALVDALRDAGLAMENLRCGARYNANCRAIEANLRRVLASLDGSTP